MKSLKGDLPLPRRINPAIPEVVERVILKAMAREPENRYGSAREMAEALKQALEAPVAPAVPVAPPLKPEAVPAVEAVKPVAIVEEAKRPIPWPVLSKACPEPSRRVEGLPLAIGGGVVVLLVVATASLAALLVSRVLGPGAPSVPTRMALPPMVSTTEPTATPMPSPTAPATLQPTATSEGVIIAPEPRLNGPLIFADDFSDGANGAQPLFKDEWMAFEYMDGKGRLTSSYRGAVMPAMYPVSELADFYAEFDFQTTAAAPDSGYGFIFRSDDTEGGSLD